MSFNIRGSFVNDGDNVWPSRAKLNYETIKKYSPDLIGFQELQKGNWETYHESLPEYEKIMGPQYNNSEPFCYPSIFYNPAKFDIVEKGHFWLSETPKIFSSAWDTRCIRSALWTRLQYRNAPRPTILLLNTHLDHVSEQARIKGARLIIETIRTIRNENESVLITGDFNCNPGSDVHTAFLRAGYQDTYISSGNSDDEQSYVFHAFAGTRHATTHRIDWILLLSGFSDLRAVQASIIRDAKEPLYPSDHYPIIADLLFNSG